MSSEPRKMFLPVVCLLISTATIAVEYKPRFFAKLCCAELMEKLPQSSPDRWFHPDDSISAMASMSELAVRINAHTFEAAAFRFIGADLNPLSFGRIGATATWKKWLAANLHPAAALKALCLVVTYITLNPLNIWMAIIRWRRPSAVSSDEDERVLALILLTGGLFAAGVLVPATLVWLLSLVHPFEPEQGRVLLNCLHFLVWLLAWIVSGVYGFVMYGIHLFVVPVILIVTIPILLLHGWLFG